jgi:hypothetical protein
MSFAGGRPSMTIHGLKPRASRPAHGIAHQAQPLIVHHFIFVYRHVIGDACGEYRANFVFHDPGQVGFPIAKFEATAVISVSSAHFESGSGGLSPGLSLRPTAGGRTELVQTPGQAFAQGASGDQTFAFCVKKPGGERQMQRGM